ncbi:MAG: hypothetical protein WAT12_15375 [Candidatus Nitrotoga sp.]
MVARFNGRISSVVNQTCFAGDDFDALFKVYNHRIPQHALNHLTSIQSLKKWYTEKPDIFEPLAKAPTLFISALAATKWRCCHPEVKMTKNAAKARLTPLWASATFSSFCGSTKSACAVLKSSKKAVLLSRFYQK